MPPTFEESDNLSPKYKMRLIELLLEKFTESDIFGSKETSGKIFKKNTRGLKSEMPVARDNASKQDITLEDFLRNEIFGIIGETATLSEVKKRIYGILNQIGNDLGDDFKRKFQKKSEMMEGIFNNVFAILKDEIHGERMTELAGKLGRVADILPREDAKIIPLFDPEGRKR